HDSAEMLMTSLVRAGHEVGHLTNGREALDSLFVRAPDLIVLDLRLPVFDGHAFLEVLRSYLRFANLPVIVVSAGSDAELARALRLGAQRVIPKARFELHRFLAIVRELLPPDSMTPPASPPPLPSDIDNTPFGY